MNFDADISLQKFGAGQNSEGIPHGFDVNIGGYGYKGSNPAVAALLAIEFGMDKKAYAPEKAGHESKVANGPDITGGGRGLV